MEVTQHKKYVSPFCGATSLKREGKSIKIIWKSTHSDKAVTDCDTKAFILCRRLSGAVTIGHSQSQLNKNLIMVNLFHVNNRDDGFVDFV